MKRHDRFIQSYLLFFIILLAIVFLAEVVAMYVLPRLPYHINEFYHSVLDASIMVTLSAPIIWLLIKKRNQAETALLKNEALFTLQINRMPIGCIFWDTEFRVLSWNPAAEGIFGFKEREAMGKHPYDLIVPREAQLHVDIIWKRLLEGDTTAHSVNENITKDGRTIVCSWSNTPLKENGAVIGVLSMVQDITERKKAEEELRKSEAKNRTLLNVIPDLMFQIRKDGTLLDFKASKTIETYVPPSEFLGKRVSEVLPADVAGLIMHNIERAFQTGEPQIFEYQLPMKDGVHYYEARIVISNNDEVLGIVRDITEHKQADEELQKAHRRVSVLYTIDRAASQSLNLNEILNEALNATMEALKVDAIGVYFLEQDGENMTLLRHHGLPQKFVENVKRIKLGEGVSGRAVAERKPVVLNVSEYPTKRLVSSIIEEGFQTIAGTPLLSGGKVFGAIILGTRRIHAFPPEEIELMASVGMQLGMAIQNALLYDKAQKELAERKKAEEQYHNLFDNANDAIITTDLEHRVTSWNKAAENLFGWTAQEVAGKKLTDLIIPEEVQAERDEIVRNALTGITFTGIETVRLRKDGTKMDVSLTISPVLNGDNKVIGLSGIIRDITERRRAQEALKIALQNWQNTFNAISDSIFILDMDGRILQSNGVFERMTGMNAEDLIDQYCYKKVHKTPNFLEGCSFERMKQTGMREVFEWEDKKRGLYFEDIAEPVYNKSGEIINAVHIMRNVTEFKKAEATRFENIQLVLANKAKSDFLAHMSHELRTPLNSVIGFSELMLGNDGKLNEKQRHYVNNILTSGKHLLALINDILDLSKVEAGKIDLTIEKISVPETIDEALTFVKEKAMKHNVTIKKDIDDLEIEADKQRVKQILFNLLSNAVKFSKLEGGVVTVTAKKEEDMAKISVSDTGIGIKEQDMKKLFLEFEQLDSGISKKYGGTGLGLSISKKLVELHGGKIRAESKYGEGSTFTFLLPLKAKKQEGNI